ncbi:hypothetical protein RHGRI_035490 [Rhododendron griersonianum]|uniref:Uncharacterized protein n=1 Tax=Rhododendron griersonianum TaxID=479676 RepID=A0AAV6HJA7_9ERIC|nr:hypothetical protein RHGRI_035490 [Rhododendron griersonianum]
MASLVLLLKALMKFRHCDECLLVEGSIETNTDYKDAGRQRNLVVLGGKEQQHYHDYVRSIVVGADYETTTAHGIWSIYRS